MKRITLQLAALLLLASFCYAADTQIKDLTDGSGSVAGTWKVVCDNGTTTYICTANSLLALKIGTVTNAQVCVGDSSSKIQCTTDPNTWAAAAHTHTGTYVPYSWIVQAGSNNVLTYTGDYSLGLTLTGNTSVTLPTSGTLATTSFKPSDLNIASQTAGDILYFNGTAWTRLAKDPGKYLKSGDSAVSWETVSGGTGYVDVSGTPANHYWTTWVDDDTIKGTAVTASKPVCTDSNGEPAVCAGTEGVWAALGQANTFTENNTFGDSDTDTLTIRSLIVGGNSRAVWIAGSAPTPTYATGSNELYVGGDIESGGNVYAANFISTGTGESYISFGNNSSGRSPTAGAYEMYVDTGVFKLNQNGTEYTVPIATTDYTLSITTTGNTTVTLPTSGTLATLGGEETFSGAKTFSSIITANANLAVGNGSTGPGQVRLMEDSDNGTDYSTITGASDAGSYPSFTFSGSQGSEDLTLTASSNKWKLSSSTGVTMISTGSIPFTGAINVKAKSAGYTVGTDDADEAYGTLFISTASSTITFTLPSAAAGMNMCFKNTQGNAQSIRIDAASGDYIVKSDGNRTSASGEYYGCTASASCMVCVVAYDDTDWHVVSERGTWAEE